MIAACSPVPVPDLIALYNEHRLNSLRAKAAIVQAARSESIGWYRVWPQGRTLLAAFLLYPRERAPLDHREVLFSIRPTAALHLKRIMWQARLIVAAMPDDVLLTLHAETDAGLRLAEIAGFSCVGGTTYEWRGNGELRQRDQDAVHRRRHERAGCAGEQGARE